MAEEYLHAGNYQMAKRFFERIVQPYQKEGWWLVLASVQRSLLTCAIHLGQVLVANRKRPGHVRGGGGGTLCGGPCAGRNWGPKPFRNSDGAKP